MTDALSIGTEALESFQLPGPLFAQAIAVWPANRNGRQIIGCLPTSWRDTEKTS